MYTNKHTRASSDKEKTLSTEDTVLQEYFEICRRAYEQQLRDGSWPWADSPNTENVLDSKDNPPHV